MKRFKPKEILEMDRELEKTASYMRFSISASESGDNKHDGSDEKALAQLRWALLAERRIMWNRDKSYMKRRAKHQIAGFKNPARTKNA